MPFVSKVLLHKSKIVIRATLVDGWRSLPLGRPTHRQPLNTQRRLADADGHALAFFTADADAFVERHVVTDHGDFGERVGPVANQRSALDRVHQFAVFDLPCFIHGEHEFAVGDIDLAAAEIHGVNAVFDARDDFLRIAITA